MQVLLVRQLMAATWLAISWLDLAGAAGPSCNGTILEWNIGILDNWGSFRLPALSEFLEYHKFGLGNMNIIPALRTWDLDFQATWNPIVRAAWGAPRFSPPADLNPCLRIRPLALDGAAAMQDEFMQAQANALCNCKN